MQNKKRLLIAASHGATTASALVEEIKSRNLLWDIYFIGKKYSSESKRSVSLEYQILPEMGVTFIELESGKIEAKFTRYTIPALLKIPLGVIQSLLKLLKVKPDLVLSLGGASGALVSFWAWILRIPVIIHEQTSSGGRANVKSSLFAKKVLLSRESSLQYFPNHKSVVVGNPLNKSVSKYLNMTNREVVRTILFMGGSRGSRWINNALKPVIPELSAKYKIVHLTGAEDYSNFVNMKAKNYLAIAQVMPDKVVELISQADVVVSRAGANTVSLLIALKKPSLLIPIPWSYLDEQNENARYMENLEFAALLQQSELTPQRLLSEIEKLISQYPQIIKKTKSKVSPDRAASEKIIDYLEKYI
jgi:UDP-N-acetylglucosamine--N-acetylmuramyl-(pentapeptide) pyrophosphoryl-undecaprenol N-acetylglucosamine transferase